MNLPPLAELDKYRWRPEGATLAGRSHNCRFRIAIKGLHLGAMDTLLSLRYVLISDQQEGSAMAMDMQGEERIEAPIQKVWEALNDPDVLKECIPGCQSLEKKSDTELEAVVSLKIGPIKAKFQGAVELKNLNPPHSYTIQGEGKGGIAGFAKGGADVALQEDGAEATILTYKAKADVGGKMAQLGSRLIDSTSKKLAGQFFDTFNKKVSGS
jgi:carbon monoxide dehydrogenase subunit G